MYDAGETYRVSVMMSVLGGSSLDMVVELMSGIAGCMRGIRAGWGIAGGTAG